MSGNRNSGRRPLPGNVHLLRGNPSKKGATEITGAAPAPKTEAPPCPSWLSKEAKAEWRRIVKDLVTLGLVAKIDRAELSVYCTAWADWKVAREKIAEMEEDGYVMSTPSGYKQMSVWMQVANRAEERMRAAGNSFGLNPSARAKLGASLPAQGELFPNEQAETARKYGL
ncbi:phage terminase small subunit P27 family [Alcanivoracaceae bacterium MT1]